MLVAPLITTIRDIPTAVRLGPADGIDRDGIATLDNLTLLRRDRFVRRIGLLGPERMTELSPPRGLRWRSDIAPR